MDDYKKLIEELRGEAALIDAGMNIDDGQTIDFLTQAATALEGLMEAHKAVTETGIRHRDRATAAEASLKELREQMASGADIAARASGDAASETPRKSTDNSPEPPWPVGAGNNAKRVGWYGFFSANARDECPFPPGRKDLLAGYREGWDAAFDSIYPPDTAASVSSRSQVTPASKDHA